MSAIPVQIICDPMDRELYLSDPDFGDVLIEIDEYRAARYWADGMADGDTLEEIAAALDALFQKSGRNGVGQIRAVANVPDGPPNIRVIVYGDVSDTHMTTAELRKVARKAHDTILRIIG